MSKAVFAYNNLAVGASITGTATDAEHPHSMLIDYMQAHRCWINAGAGEIILDLLSAQAIQGAGLIHTNLTSDVTITLQGNSDNVWTSPPLDTTIAHKARNQVKILSSVESHRWWRFAFSGGSLSDIRIGQLFLGPALQLTKNFRRGYGRRRRHPRLSQATAYEVERTYVLGERRDILHMPFRLPREDLENIEDAWEAMEGGAKPCLFLPDPEDIGKQVAWYVKLPADLDEQFNHFRLYDLGELVLQLVEETPVLEA